MPVNDPSPLRRQPPPRQKVEAVSRFGWAGELRPSQDRAARRRERLREHQVTQAWLRQLAGGRAAGPERQ